MAVCFAEKWTKRARGSAPQSLCRRLPTHTQKRHIDGAQRGMTFLARDNVCVHPFNYVIIGLRRVFARSQ
jgi:hypothetical protein